MTELHLFAGAGGGILAGLLLGHTPVAAVEIEPYCQEVLRARQRDGCLPKFPIFGDIREFDGRPWAGRVDVVAGGFPCQDISVAGKGAGIDGERSGLWSEMARVIGEIRPRYAFVENVPALVGRGLAVVLGDLAALGYDARWTVLGAHDVGAPHKRDRLWILAESNSEGREPDNGRRAVPDEERHGASALREPQQPAGAGGTGSVADAERVRQSPSSDGAFGCQASRNGEPPELARGGGQVPDADRLGELQPGGGIDEQRRRVGDLGSPVPIASSPRLAQREGAQAERAHNATARGGRWPVEPGLGGAAHGLAGWLDRPDPWRDGWEDSTPRTTLGTPKRADRLRAIGNGQVPQTAAAAWQLLMGWSIEGEIQ